MNGTAVPAKGKYSPKKRESKKKEEADSPRFNFDGLEENKVDDEYLDEMSEINLLRVTSAKTPQEILSKLKSRDKEKEKRVAQILNQDTQSMVDLGVYFKSIKIG